MADDPPERPQRPGHGLSRREGVTHESLRIRQPRQPRARHQGPRAVPKCSAALSGGTDLISRMKDYVTSPERVVYLKDIKALAGISGDPKSDGLTIGAGTTLADDPQARRPARGVPGPLAGHARGRHAADPQHGHRRRQPPPAPPLLVLPRGQRPARHEGRQEPRPRGGQPLPRHLHDRRRRPLRQPVEPGRPPDRPRRQGDDPRARRASGPSRSRRSTRSPRRTGTAS